jgi:hypothetical protein
VCLSGPVIAFIAGVVVPLCWSCAAAVVCVVAVFDEAVEFAAVPLCPELFVVAAGAVVAEELPLFFFAFVVDVVCAVAIDPATRNALIQKPAANFK